ncbi:hypothetical protein [Flavobacteriaceae bacterium 14752]|uniref:hypothetical protein n=1 Tax=Mesohalobacter salilacus TaxID=2491711 RepID=UPI000F62C544|nr:hypothetical protein EIG84_07735 [Flavobacteriaceae bacterium 14752]
MIFLKALFRFYINSSIHVALAVVALLVFTHQQFEISLDYALISFVFFGSVTGYNFVKYAPVAKLHHRSLTNQLRQIQIFSFCCFLGLGISAFFLDIKVLLVCGVLGLLTLLYAIPIYNKNLRETSVLKVFIIALIWATVSFLLPFLKENLSHFYQSNFWWLNYVERFIWILLLMIPFEIRDLRFDETYLKTLVSIIGVTKIKILSILVLTALATHKFLDNNYQNILIYIIIYSSFAGFILSSKKIQKPYFASFWVEALPIFWLFMWYLLSL